MLRTILSVFALAALSACVSSPQKAVVQYAVDSQATVLVGDTTLAEGDKVGFFLETCRERRGVVRDTSQTVCSRDRVASGTVLGLMAEGKQAAIEVASGARLQKGLYLEKDRLDGAN